METVGTVWKAPQYGESSAKVAKETTGRKTPAARIPGKQACVGSIL